MDIEGGKALCRVIGIGGGQVHIDAPPVAKNLAVKVKLLHPPMRDGGHPLQLRRLVEIPHNKVGVLLPYAIVYGVWAERIHDPLPIHDELILDPRRPAKLQRVVKDPGLSQGGQSDAPPVPLVKLAAEEHPLGLRAIVEEMDSRPIDHGCAHGLEHLQELLHCLLSLLPLRLLQPPPPSREGRGGFFTPGFHRPMLPFYPLPQPLSVVTSSFGSVFISFFLLACLAYGYLLFTLSIRKSEGQGQEYPYPMVRLRVENRSVSSQRLARD